ncbi:hypothetical protein [Haloarcula halophila]|uniref:hypothetical protein n=1 Tax=Haloarcula TaxID=2237 RepID=UPI0023E38C77|nr:hypothetical protein [Halomicroarcula sp. DFY41]
MIQTPAAQALELAAQFINQFAAPIAIAVGLYWAWILYRRTIDDTDPSVRKFGSSALGSWSVLVSGAYASALLAAFIAFVTWPAPMETPILAALLLGGVAFHAAMEKREDMEAAS